MNSSAQDHLLSILVMDFGYTDEPKHGHSPLRHQFAWEAATNGVEPSDLQAKIQSHLTQAEKDLRQASRGTVVTIKVSADA